jgi:tRNA-splicing ligase RtcB (3'-phosphate/5'-hydroxy nucleic acid ligase)
MPRVSEKITTFLPWQEIEEGARQQIVNTSELPFLFKWVAVMPDCHYGKGATVGTVIATKGAIVPAAVGVDIGCGMIALETPLRRDDLKDLHAIREGIERRIPMSAGRNNHRISPTAAPRVAALEKIERATGGAYDKFDNDWRRALGTLGGGNHFTEVCVDENDFVWLTLHSGSRGVGNKIGNHYIRRAQEICKKKGIVLPDRDLAFLEEGTEDFDNYIRDLHWAQTFARLNRDEMMDRMVAEIGCQVLAKSGGAGEPERGAKREAEREAEPGAERKEGTKDDRELELSRINCHHNFTQIERHYGHDVWVTRKGAVQAKTGMAAMIPGSMGTRSYIVTGLGNREAFESAPHGAGRRMSRTKARQAHNMKDLEAAMAGIEFRKSRVLLDEIPAAYKDIDHVMEQSRDLVHIEHTLRQIINCKGD